MKRREFIKKTGKAVALAAVVGDAGMLVSGCQSGEKAGGLAVKPDFEVPVDPNLPKVVLAKNEDHAEAVRMALGGIGGIRRFVSEGERVLLKPNVAFDRVPIQAVNTNPEVIGEMVRQCLSAGVSEVLVTDNGPSDPERTFRRSGVQAAVENAGGKLIYVSDDDFVEADLKGKVITTWPVLKYVFEIDKLINMPIAKHHGMAFGTSSMKNFFGAIGGNRGQLHDEIHQAIVDLASYFRPTLTVVDATRVLTRSGPAGGSIDDVQIFDSVICATDQVAADSRALEFLDFTGSDIDHVALAYEQGLGEIDYRKAGYLELP